MDTFIGISLVIAGFIWFLWSLYSLWKGRESDDWNITTGIITKSKVFEPYRKGNPSVPIVHYEYSLKGRPFYLNRKGAVVFAPIAVIGIRGAG